MTDATRAKISAALKGKTKSEQHRQRLAAANLGKPLSAKHRQSLKDAWLRRTPEERAAFSANGRRVSLAVQRDRSLNTAWWNDLTAEERAEVIAKRSKSLKAAWNATPPPQRSARVAALKEAGMKGAVAARSAKPTTIEVAAASLLDALGIAYLREQRIGRYVVDFLIEGRRVVVECDGSYWHSLPNVAARDVERDRWLSSQGFTVIRLPESDIRSGRVADRLREIA